MRARSIDARRLASLALLAALAIVPYLNSLEADFTFDDPFVVRDNPVVQDASIPGMMTFVQHPGPVWRPLTMLSYGANRTIDGSARGYHAVNVGLHLAVTLVAFALATVLTGSRPAALAAAAMFAVHPIHTEAVTGIVGRAEVLAALAVLASLLAAARSLAPETARARAWYALSVAVFAVAPFAKESALTGLGLLIALHVWLEPRATLRQRLWFALPFVLAALLYPLLKVAVVGSIALPAPSGEVDNPLVTASSATRVRTAIVVLWEYVQQLALPVRLSADYSYNQIPLALSWLDPRLLIAVSSFVALAAAVAAAGKRAPVFALSAVFFLVPLTVTSNLLFPIGTIKAERFLYLPSFGWCLGVGVLALAAADQRRRAAAAALAVVIVALGARTWVRNADWQNDFTLFQAASVTSFDSAKVHYNFGVGLEKRGLLDDASVHFRRSLEIYPGYAQSALGIGSIYYKKGLDAGAIHWYERAVRTDWRLARAHLNLGLTRFMLGEYGAAEAAFLQGLESEPGNPKLLVNLAASKLAQNDVWGARAALDRVPLAERKDPETRELLVLASRAIDEVAVR